MTLPFDTMQPELLTISLNKPRINSTDSGLNGKDETSLFARTGRDETSKTILALCSSHSLQKMLGPVSNISLLCTESQGKAKMFPVLNQSSTTPWRRMEELRYSSTIPDVGTRWTWVVSLRSRPLYPRYPLNRRLGGPQSQSGRCGVLNSSRRYIGSIEGQGCS
jgi:hypothetical protein